MLHGFKSTSALSLGLYLTVPEPRKKGVAPGNNTSPLCSFCLSFVSLQLFLLTGMAKRILHKFSVPDVCKIMFGERGHNQWWKILPNHPNFLPSTSSSLVTNIFSLLLPNIVLNCTLYQKVENFSPKTKYFLIRPLGK